MGRKGKHQTKRARGTVLLSALLAAVLLCACGKKPVGTGSDPSASTAQSNGPALHMLTEPRALLRASTQTENGYYETVSNHEFSENIVYTDYATKSRVYLCNDPGCKHDSESCSSYLPLHQVQALFTDGTYLYADTHVINEGDIYTQRGELLRMGLDGSNREVLAEPQSGESFSGAYASDGKILYFTKLVYLEPSNDKEEEKESDNISVRLSCIDLDTKEVTELYDFGTDSLWNKTWVGCVGREMIFCDRDLPEVPDPNYKVGFMYRAFNVDTQTWRNITEEPLYEETGIWTDGKSIWVSKDDKTINTLDFATGEIHQAELEREIPKRAEFRCVQDGKLLALWAEADHDVSITVDTQTGAVMDAPVFNSETSGKSSVMDILANFGEEYLVETAPKQVPVTYFNLDGSVEQYKEEVCPQALISKDDYWAGKQNITMIDDHVNFK